MKKIKSAPKQLGSSASKSNLEAELPSPKQTRLEFMRNKLLGIALWQKDTQDQELKSIIDEFTALKKDEIENYPPEEKNRLILEAELFFSEKASLAGEFLKIKKKLKRKK